MLINFNSIKNTVVASVSEREKLGKLNDLVIDPETGKILCFFISKGFLKSKQIISPQDIVNLSEEFILINSSENLVDLSEIVRANEIVKQKIYLLGQKVVNPQKKTIGEVIDLSFDQTSFRLNRINVEAGDLKNVLKGERIIPWNKILKITNNFVMVKEIEQDKIKNKVKEFVGIVD